MNCGKCPHRAEMERALAPCQTCECAGGGRGQGDGCTRCAQMAIIRRSMRPCEACEAGKLHGQVSTDAGGAEGLALRRALPADRRRDGYATNLNHDVEDALRKALCALFQFDPIQLLLIRHVCNGRNVGTFREPLAELKERLTTRYDLSSEGSTNFRALAHAWKEAVVRKMPSLAPFFDAVTDANAGSCRR